MLAVVNLIIMNLNEFKLVKNKQNQKCAGEGYVFKGNIKNISELKKVLTMLNIDYGN